MLSFALVAQTDEHDSHNRGDTNQEDNHDT